MSIELKDYLFDSGTALVLHSERELVDADLAELCDFSKQQRAAITSVVLSDTAISGTCFRYLAFLPNLKALYVNKTRVNDEAPFEYLPQTIEIINLDHTEVGDLCVSKLRRVRYLRSIRLGKTGVTDCGVNILATMSYLSECYVDGMAVSKYARQRLENVMVLRTVTFKKAVSFILFSAQFEARKLMNVSIGSYSVRLGYLTASQFIMDHLWRSLPDPPFAADAKATIAEQVYSHIWQQSANGVFSLKVHISC